MIYLLNWLLWVIPTTKREFHGTTSLFRLQTNFSVIIKSIRYKMIEIMGTNWLYNQSKEWNNKMGD